ncbi:MAG: hypothetical protein IPJ74_12545 [Saprospiraceae bacterium]|nr:hypothetical protein [Saprospiraceae bacterium]
MKTLLIGILALCTSIISYAQRDTLPDPEAFFSAIIVKNIDTSIVWYADILGFKVLNQNANSEKGFKQANLKRGDVLIELIELKTSLYPADILSNQPRGTQIGGFFKFGFLVAEFDKWINFLSDTKV